MEIDPKYFDYAASTPVWPEALVAFVENSTHQYANPSSIHFYGKNAKEKLLELKRGFCESLQFHDGRFLLCASGSEANNTIIEGHLSRFPKGKILIAEDVHDSIWYATKKHRKSVQILRIDQTGQIKVKAFESALSKQVTLVCITHVCNETGVIQAVKDLANICHKQQLKLLIDGMQAIGHIPVDLSEIPFSYYSVSGHKFGAVKSTGGVFIRDSAFDSLVLGGKQQWNLRAGTEDIAGMASMVAAMKQNNLILYAELKRLQDLKFLLISRLRDIPRVILNTSEQDAPGILSISFPGFTGREIVGALSLAGFGVSTGSACHSNQIEPSRILVAMGRTTAESRGTIRISLGRATTHAAVNELVDALMHAVKS